MLGKLTNVHDKFVNDGTRQLSTQVDTPEHGQPRRTSLVLCDLVVKNF